MYSMLGTAGFLVVLSNNLARLLHLGSVRICLKPYDNTLQYLTF